MATSSEFDNNILALAAGLFNAPPGFAALADLRQTFTGGASLLEVTSNLMRSDLFLSQYPIELSNAHFAARFLSNLVGSQVSFAELVTAAVELARLLETGLSRAEVTLLAISTLQNLPPENAQWRDAGKAFENKLEVARYHSIERESPTTTLEELQKVLALVSHTTDSIMVGRQRAEGRFEPPSPLQTTSSDADATAPSSPVITVSDADNVLTVTAGEYAALGTLDMAGGFDTLEITDTAGAALNLELSIVEHVERLLLSSATGLRQAPADLSVWGSLTQVELALGLFTVPQTVTLPAGVTQLTLRDSSVLSPPRAAGMTVSVTPAGTGLSSLDASGLQSGGMVFTAATTSGGITVMGSGGADTVTTGNGDDVFHYSAGKDVLNALGGSDTLVVGEDFLDQLASLSSSCTGFEQLRLDSSTGLHQDKADVSTLAGFSSLSVALAAATAAQALTLADAMTHVTVSNPGSSTSLQSKSLSTLTLQGGTADSDIQVLHGTPAHALTVRVREHAAGALITDAKAGVVTLHSLGTKANTVALAMPDATQLDAVLDADLTLAATGTDLSALERLDLTGTMAFSADVSGLGSLTLVDASAGSGTNTVTLDPRVTAYTGGAGKDTVTISVAPTQLLDGGDGDDDTLHLHGITLPATHVKGFETIVLSDQVFGKGSDYFFWQSTTHTTELVVANASGSADKFSIVLIDTSAIDVDTVQLNDVESIVVVGTDYGPLPDGSVAHSLVLAADSVKNLTISGNATVTLTSLSTTLTAVDARDLALGALHFTGSKIAGPLKLGGSGQNDILDVSQAIGTVTVTDTDGDDTVTTGSGNDLFEIRAGRNVFDGGSGTDTVEVLVPGSADVDYNIGKLENIERLVFRGNASGTYLVDGVSLELVQHAVASLTHIRGVGVSSFSFVESSARTTRFGIGDAAVAPATLTLDLQGPSIDIGTVEATGFKGVAVNAVGSDATQTMRMTLNTGSAETLTLAGGDAKFVTTVSGAGLKTIDATAFTSGSLSLTVSDLTGNVELKAGSADTTFAITSSPTALVTMLGGSGHDSLNASPSAVTLQGGGGNDTLSAVSSAATLYGDEGDDTLLLTGTGSQAYGGSGNDFFTIGGKAVASHSLHLGDGNDTVVANLVTATSKFSTIHDIQPGDQLHVLSTKNNYPETLDLTTVTPLVLGGTPTLQNYYDAIFGIAGGVPQWRWFAWDDSLYLVYDTDTVTQFTRPDFGIILEGLVDLTGVTYSNDGTYAKFFF